MRALSKHGSVLHSTDAVFSCFQGLKSKNSSARQQAARE
jgi:hypothetical protein